MTLLVLQLENSQLWNSLVSVTAEPIPIISYVYLSHIFCWFFLWRMLTNNRGNTLEPEDITRTPRECYKQLNAHKFNNFEEMDNYLKINIYQKFKQDEIGNTNSLKTMKETESVT